MRVTTTKDCGVEAYRREIVVYAAIGAHYLTRFISD